MYFASFHDAPFAMSVSTSVIFNRKNTILTNSICLFLTTFGYNEQMSGSTNELFSLVLGP